MTLQIYNEDGSTTMYIASPLFDKPVIIKHDEFENWVIDSIVRGAERNGELYREPAPHEFAEIFPECKKFFNAELKDIKRKLIDLQDETNTVTGRKVSKEIDPSEGEFILAGIEAHRERLLARKKELDTVLMFTGSPRKKKVAEDFAIAIQKAKEYPIENLIEIKRKTARCLWHDDSDPSMHYYKKDNKVHCFVCDKQWDSIDVVQKLHDCSMKDAVEIINGV